MVEARIPVDLTNPGQVFACLGFLEAAEVLLGGAAGGFDWSNESAVMFRLDAKGNANPIKAVLEFLAECGIESLSSEDVQVYPCRPPKASESPIRLHTRQKELLLDHWCDSSGRETFKTFAGQQDALNIVEAILLGGESTQWKAGDDKPAQRPSLKTIFENNRDGLIADPYDVLLPIKKPKPFCFDARGSWDAIRIGASIDTQGSLISVSPLVEILAPIGLSNARPRSLSSYELEYGVWCEPLPLILARAVFGMAHCLPRQKLGQTPAVRSFTTHMGNDKYYKKFFFAEETRP